MLGKVSRGSIMEMIQPKAGYVMLLLPQKETLEESTMTRPWLEHESLDNGNRIDLSEFTALKLYASIIHFFVGG